MLLPCGCHFDSYHAIIDIHFIVEGYRELRINLAMKGQKGSRGAPLPVVYNFDICDGTARLEHAIEVSVEDSLGQVVDLNRVARPVALCLRMRFYLRLCLCRLRETTHAQACWILRLGCDEGMDGRLELRVLVNDAFEQGVRRGRFVLLVHGEFHREGGKAVLRILLLQA